MSSRCFSEPPLPEELEFADDHVLGRRDPDFDAVYLDPPSILEAGAMERIGVGEVHVSLEARVVGDQVEVPTLPPEDLLQQCLLRRAVVRLERKGRREGPDALSGEERTTSTSWVTRGSPYIVAATLPVSMYSAPRNAARNRGTGQPRTCMKISFTFAWTCSSVQSGWIERTWAALRRRADQ